MHAGAGPGPIGASTLILMPASGGQRRVLRGLPKRMRSMRARSRSEMQLEKAGRRLANRIEKRKGGVRYGYVPSIPGIGRERYFSDERAAGSRAPFLWK